MNSEGYNTSYNPSHHRIKIKTKQKQQIETQRTTGLEKKGNLKQQHNYDENLVKSEGWACCGSQCVCLGANKGDKKNR